MLLRQVQARPLQGHCLRQVRRRGRAQQGAARADGAHQPRRARDPHLVREGRAEPARAAARRRPTNPRAGALLRALRDHRGQRRGAPARAGPAAGRDRGRGQPPRGRGGEPDRDPRGGARPGDRRARAQARRGARRGGRGAAAGDRRRHGRGERARAGATAARWREAARQADLPRADPRHARRGDRRSDDRLAARGRAPAGWGHRGADRGEEGGPAGRGRGRLAAEARRGLRGARAPAHAGGRGPRRRPQGERRPAQAPRQAAGPGRVRPADGPDGAGVPRARRALRPGLQGGHGCRVDPRDHRTYRPQRAAREAAGGDPVELRAAAQEGDEAAARRRVAAQVRQPAGVDGGSGAAGAAAGPAPDGAARRRTLRDVRPQRPLPPRDQPQQPPQAAAQARCARDHHPQREADAAGVGRLADRQRPPRASGERIRQPQAEVALRPAQGQAGPLPPEPARQARGLLRSLGDRRRP